MMTALDQQLASLIQRLQGWEAVLPPKETELVLARMAGATLEELASRCGLSVPGVRSRLYGGGAGLKRRGGALGRLQAAWRASGRPLGKR